MRELESLPTRYLKYVCIQIGTLYIGNQECIHWRYVKKKCWMINYWSRLNTAKILSGVMLYTRTYIWYVYIAMVGLHKTYLHWVWSVRCLTITHHQICSVVYEESWAEVHRLWTHFCCENASSSCCTYKKIYDIENYLVKLNKRNRINRSKICTGNNWIPVVSDRYRDITREDRYCDKHDSEQNK